MSAQTDTDRTYLDRLAAERGIYANRLDVHDLPPIAHYWSHKHVRPMFERFGFSNPDDGFFQAFRTAFERRGRKVRLLSIGSGNCDVEVKLARRLLDSGRADFQLDCLDINKVMLDRGANAAGDAGVEGHLRFVEGDFNQWEPPDRECYDAIIANQSLHHVIRLEHLFESVNAGLKEHGVFAVSELIGRNGHLRWPEAMAGVREFWRRLPPSYRFNSPLDRYEEMFEDWDCSVEGFEGVRAQDILPLMLRRFHFELFVGFANIIDPFVDRVFGWNFDAGSEWDRAFIDEVHAYDERELAAGRVKPTHMFAVVGTAERTATQFRDRISPSSSLRPPEKSGLDWKVNTKTVDGRNPYAWGAWPHAPEREVEIAYTRVRHYMKQWRACADWALTLQRTGKTVEEQLTRTTGELAEARSWALGLEEQLNARTQWALRLDEQSREQALHIQKLDAEVKELRETVEGRTAWALGLDRELALASRSFDERTAWALQLDREVSETAARIAELQIEFQERTLWALELNQRWKRERMVRAELQRELNEYRARPEKALSLFFGSLKKRIKDVFGSAFYPKDALRLKGL